MNDKEKLHSNLTVDELNALIEAGDALTPQQVFNEMDLPVKRRTTLYYHLKKPEVKAIQVGPHWWIDKDAVPGLRRAMGVPDAAG